MMLTDKERTTEAAQAAKKKHPVASIAKRCGVSRQAVYGWLRGDYPIESGVALVELAELSGLTAYWIAKGRGKKYGLSDEEAQIVRAFSLFGQESKNQWLAAARDRIAQERDDAKAA